MKISKKTLIFMILTITILPLLGNENLNKILHINIGIAFLNYIIPMLLVLFLLIDYLKNKEKKKIDFSLIIAIIFILLLTISLIFSVVHKTYNFSNYFKFILMIFLILTIKNIKFEKKQIKILCYSIISISTLVALIGIIQYIFKIDLCIAGIEKYIGARGRINSTMYIATILDKYLSLNIFVILYFLYKKYINKYILISAYLLCLLALSFTFSRTGFLIYILSSLSFIILFIIKKKYLYSLFLLLITISLYFIPGEKFVISSIANYFVNISEEISEKTNTKFILKTTKFLMKPFIISGFDDRYDLQLINNIDYSLESRKYYKSVAKEIMKNNYIHGIGIGSYTYIFKNQNANNYINKKQFTAYYAYPHSMFYQLGAECGIFALITFILLLLYIAFKTCYKRKTLTPILLFIIIMFMSYTETVFYQKEICYTITIFISLFNNKYFIKGIN